MKMTEEMVDYVSALARLKLPEEERARMTGELEQILAYMDVLNALDTSSSGAHEPCVPGEERHAGGRGAPLRRPSGPAGQRAGARRGGFPGAQDGGVR